MEPSDAKPSVFISYSHKDEDWKDRLVSQLGVLEHEGLLSVWEDRKISAGDDWLPEIEAAIGACRVAVLLISAEFLNSKFIRDKEVPELLKRREMEGVRVIPLILKPCAWPLVSWLSSIQSRPKDGKPLSAMTRNKAEAALAALAEEVANLLSPSPEPNKSNPAKPNSPPQTDLSKLPAGASDFLGRVDELKLLDDAWGDAGRTQIVELVAPGGTGKTALVKRWLDRLKADGWRGARRVYGWNFYSQGASDDRQASDDAFLSAALDWFGVKIDPALSPWDKGKKLADGVAAGRSLLVLDGVEPLQYPPGPQGGQLRAPGLQALLNRLAGSGQPGLCVVTTRERVKDLEEYRRSVEYPEGGLVHIDLGNLSDGDGGRLLHKLGVQCAGSAEIDPNDDELRQGSREVHGHALTLSLLGGYLAQAQGGDIRRRDQVKFDRADEEIRGGQAFKVVAVYERWFAREGERGARELAALRLLGFFDRPADEACLAALRQSPPIACLTEPLMDLSAAQWNLTLSRLRECGLIEASQPGSTTVDAHPLVREYLAKALRENQPEAWREGHRRLYEHLKSITPYRPDGLAGLQPLYQAVYHGCLAGFNQETCTEVYESRILQGTGTIGYFSLNKLGAFGADLVALACFFDEPWSKLSSSISINYQSWLLNQTAICLRAVGRLNEALEPLRAGIEIGIQLENWENVARGISNLSELELTLGLISDSVRDAEKSAKFADQSYESLTQIGNRTTLAEALHQQGKFYEALRLFQEAEAIQAVHNSKLPMLYSLQGFRYCNLLLSQAEGTIWRRLLISSSSRGECLDVVDHICQSVKQRAEYALEIVMNSSQKLLDIALCQLYLGLSELFVVIKNGKLSPLTLNQVKLKLNSAIDGMRAAGSQHHVPRSLLARAWLHALAGDPAAARADLDEAWQIASRGGMRLYMADIHLHRARLFRDKGELAKARALIEECGYWRRREELEDAEQAAKDW